MRRLLFIFSFFCLPVASAGAQDTLALEDCLKIGIENNLSLQSKRKEIQKGRYGISENRHDCCPKSMVLPIIMITSTRLSPLPTAQLTAIPTM